MDYMKRTGPVVARQLKKHNQPGIQVLAMRRVQQAAWQMAHSPDDAGNRRWEAYIKLTKEYPRNSAKWKRPLTGRPTYLERPFTRLLGDAWLPKIKVCKTWTERRSLTKELQRTWHAMLNLKPPEPAAEMCDVPVEREKRPRDGSDPWTLSWCTDEKRRMEIIPDSRVVVCWVNGAWEVEGGERAEIVLDIVDQFVRWYLGDTFRQRTNEADWCRHIHRERNLAAHTHANWLINNRDSGAGALTFTAGHMRCDMFWYPLTGQAWVVDLARKLGLFGHATGKAPSKN